MDDTTWISGCKNDLEQTLEVADSFFVLNDIKINKDKSVLLKYEPNNKHDYSTLQLKFGSDTINIKPKERNESDRILGVWININCNRSFVKSQIKNEITSFCNLMKYKKATDKQVLYLWNMVIIPRIEYRAQITHISQREFSFFTSIFRRTFKHLLNISSTMPNAIMENRYIYNFRNPYDVHIQEKISNFLIQLNDRKLLGRITALRLKKIQHQEWLVKSLLVDWKETTFARDDYKRFCLAWLLPLISITFQLMLTF